MYLKTTYFQHLIILFLITLGLESPLWSYNRLLAKVGNEKILRPEHRHHLSIHSCTKTFCKRDNDFLFLKIKSNFIAQTYSSDPNLNDLLIEGMEKGIKGDYQAAISTFTQVIKINPYEVEAYYNRGIAYGRTQNYQQAIADFEKALSLDKESPEVYLERAKVRLLLGEKSQAITDFKTAAQLFKKQGNSYDYQETQKLLNTLN